MFNVQSTAARLTKLIFVSVTLVSVFLSSCRWQPPRSTPASNQSQSTSLPADEPAVEASSDWKAYASKIAPVQFSYPPDWTEAAPGELSGSDGFARLESLPYEGQSHHTVCQGEANRGRPGRYGAYPEIIDITSSTGEGANSLQGSQADAKTSCLIMPSADQPQDRNGEGVYLFWMPSTGPEDLLYALRADRRHIQALVKTLVVPPAAAAAELTCNLDVQGAEAHTWIFGDLSVYEFPVAQGASCNPFENPQGFRKATLSTDPASRTNEVINTSWSDVRVNAFNADLKTFSYALKSEGNLIKVFKGQEEIHNNISWVGSLTVKNDQTDFIFPLVDTYNGNAYVLRAAGLQPLDTWDVLLFDRIFPVFVGQDEISLAYDYERYPRTPNNPALVNVYRNGQITDTLSVSGSGSAGGTVRGIWSWNDRWLVELSGLLIEDGKILNDEMGYSEMFNWRMLGGKPFYFFRVGKSINLSLDGQPQAFGYDQVIHEPLCCTQMLLSMKNYAGGMTFFALRGDVWYYVILRMPEG